MIKTWTTRILLGFAFITLGFAWGKHSALNALQASGDPAVAAEASARVRAGDQLIVYSAHLTFRCWECTEIERLARDLVNQRFPDQLAGGVVDFRVIDFQRQPAFAHRYNIVSSTVLLVHERDGEEVGFDRLDEVWTLTRDPAAFHAYVAHAMEARLAAAGVIP
ncbi:MAG TPA: nitrophenyl compound nitroreductase subunit ArsF family protein [Kiritimatiellia bacterium]|nr:nitrophenyl compound nitroreductase subunit ArsF family protein [Kiritimatiellia bacterium]